VPAQVAIGAPDFVSTPACVTGSFSSSCFASGVAVDPTTGKVFLVTFRGLFGSAAGFVSRFPATALYTTGVPSEATFGNGSTCQNGDLVQPSSINIDNFGSCWISDFNLDRVVRIDHCSSYAPGNSFQQVIGKQNFTSCSSGNDASHFTTPQGVWYSKGTLWVTGGSFGNGRVLGIKNVRARGNGPTFDVILTGPTISITFNLPKFVSVDFHGNLLVTDRNRKVVYIYANAASLTSTSLPSVTIGAANTTIVGNGGCNNQEIQPTSAIVGPDGTLYVGDFRHGRILAFLPQGSSNTPYVDFQAADYVIGQKNFTTCSSISSLSAATSQTLYPVALFFDSLFTGSLLASDYFDRGLRYCVDITSVSPTYSTSVSISHQPKSVCFHLLFVKTKQHKLLTKVCETQLKGTLVKQNHVWCCNNVPVGMTSFSWPSSCSSVSTPSTKKHPAPRGIHQKYYNLCDSLSGTATCDPSAQPKPLWTCTGFS